MTEPFPLRLHRAVSILSRSIYPEAFDAQSARAETAARVVRLEEALLVMLRDEDGARERARRRLADA